LIVAFGGTNEGSHQRDEDSYWGLKNLYVFFTIGFVVMSKVINKDNRLFSGGIFDYLILFLHISVQTTDISGSLSKRVI
jgi:hypothetical protein